MFASSHIVKYIFKPLFVYITDNIDGSPIVGETPEIRNYFVAAGLNSIGILSGMRSFEDDIISSTKDVPLRCVCT